MSITDGPIVPDSTGNSIVLSPTDKVAVVEAIRSLLGGLVRRGSLIVRCNRVGGSLYLNKPKFKLARQNARSRRNRSGRSSALFQPIFSPKKSATFGAGALAPPPCASMGALRSGLRRRTPARSRHRRTIRHSGQG